MAAEIELRDIRFLEKETGIRRGSFLKNMKYECNRSTGRYVSFDSDNRLHVTEVLNLRFGGKDYLVSDQSVY